MHPDSHSHLCAYQGQTLPEGTQTSKQKLKINKTISQHSSQGEPGFARVARTQAGGMGMADPC